MDRFVHNPRVQSIREDGRKCKEAWAVVCKQAGLPAYDYAETLAAWHRTQIVPKGTFKISAPAADGMVNLSVPASVDGGMVVYPVHVRTLLLQALTAYAGQYTDPVRFLRDAQEVARSVASRVLSPPEPT